MQLNEFFRQPQQVEFLSYLLLLLFIVVDVIFTCYFAVVKNFALRVLLALADPENSI